MRIIDKLKKSYQSIGAPAKASIWFFVCGFLQKGISFLTTPLFTRFMTTQEYGNYSVYQSWYSLIQLIVTLNLAAGVFVRGLVKNDEDKERFSSSMMGLSTTCILFWAIIYAIFHDLVNSWLGMTSIVMSAMLLEIWAVAAYQFWSASERVAFRYKKLVGLTLLYALSRPVFGLICISNVSDDLQAETRVISAAVISIVLFLTLYIKIFRKGKCFFNKTYWKYALAFNIPLIPHYLSQIVLSQADRVMIDRLCGAEEAAYYSVAYTLSMVLQILSSSISSTMNPWIYKSLEKKQTPQIGRISYYILILIAACNLMVIAAAPELLMIVAPANYQQALWVIPPVTASVYFIFLYNLFATFEFFYEKTKYVMVASVIGAILNIVLNSIFIPMFGFIAAGYTTLVCYIVYAIAHYCFMRYVLKKFMGGKKIYNIWIIIGIGMALVCCSALFMVLYKYLILRYLIILVGLIVLVWKRRSIIQIFSKLRNKQAD